MKPLIYGYLRIFDGIPGAVVGAVESNMRRFAQEEGYCFAGVFREEGDLTRRAFDELLHEIGRSEARHVVIPGMRILSTNREVRRRLKGELERRGVALHTLEPADETQVT